MEEKEDQSEYKKGGYHPVLVGEVYYKRYKVVKKIGYGHFSTVWLCLDESTNAYVAMKVQKSASNYTDAAMDEIDIVTKIHRNYSHPKWEMGEDVHIVKILNHFMHKGPHGSHICIIFELLGANLVYMMKFFNFKGMPLGLCKKITRQCLVGLDFMHRVCGVIHTDIKPENLLAALNEDQCKELSQSEDLKSFIPMIYEKRLVLVPEKPSLSVDDAEIPEKNKKRNQKKKFRQLSKEKRIARRGIIKQPKTIEIVETRFDENLDIKIVDFGNACWVHKHFCNDIQTLLYRSPEVIVGVPYNYLADIWSMGCVVFELIFGQYLFNPTVGNDAAAGGEILSELADIFGLDDYSWAKNSKNARLYLENGKLKKVPNSRKKISEMMQEKGIDLAEAQMIEDFLKKMLNPDPGRRETAIRLLSHPWLNST